MSTVRKVSRQEMVWGGKTLVLETGRVATQATGSVIASYGGTTVLCAVVGVPEAKPDAGFFPLSVHYQEKAFSAGKIPGGFFKREGKPTERETLISRLIDRPIRPLFPEGFLNEVQVICTVLSHDLETDPDIVAMIGASAALTLSGMPFLGPIGACRVGYAGGKYVLNPSQDETEKGQLDLVVAGTSRGVMMVESEIHELGEDVVWEAVNFGHRALQDVIKLIIALAEEAAKEPWEVASHSEVEDAIKKRLGDLDAGALEQAYQERDKIARHQKVKSLRDEAMGVMEAEGFEMSLAERFFKDRARDIVRTKALKEGTRIDGRDTKTIRPIVCEIGILPQVHGSALFTRGATQALAVSTLGSGDDAQIIDSLTGEYKEDFLLHYNFPPYSVGEAGRFVGPGRREIGHGKLAWRAIHPILPSAEKFPYTLRVVSEITESDGSSSMATVCATSLSLMDAGVPLPRPVAGIAMGLIKEGDDFAVLSDITGDEDSLGDMDFKVAGTEKGITALQMDIKITSITPEIMKVALEQARQGRLHILNEMKQAIDAPRQELNPNAPRMEMIRISKDKIRDVIGPGGKVIRDICETTGAKLDVQDDGTVKIFSPDAESLRAATERVRAITYEPQTGDVFTGKVVKIMEFGAFVNFLPGQDGLVHISEISSERVSQVSDVLKEGEKVKVKIVGFDARGKIKLSMKQAVARVAAEGG